MSSLPIEIASTIQSASINKHPDPDHDINPSTAASFKEPVRIASDASASDIDADEDEIPVSILRPVPRRQTMPPLPDLRFEQSYLKSIEGAETRWAVAWITARDQVILPLVQGVMWTLILAGWKTFNQASEFSGASVGARIRRWWWGVNGWNLPTRAA